MYDKVCVCVFGCMYVYISDRFANKLTLNVSVKSFMCVCDDSELCGLAHLSRYHTYMF